MTSEVLSTELSPQAAGYVRAINTGDAAAFVALFDDEAVVEDAGRVHRGAAAIREWAEREIFAARVTLEVLGRSVRGGEEIVTTKVDGEFDRTGLPDPLLIDQCLAVKGGKIAGVKCVLRQVG
jgi:hypothetical protein